MCARLEREFMIILKLCSEVDVPENNKCRTLSTLHTGHPRRKHFGVFMRSKLTLLLWWFQATKTNVKKYNISRQKSGLEARAHKCTTFSERICIFDKCFFIVFEKELSSVLQVAYIKTVQNSNIIFSNILK